MQRLTAISVLALLTTPPMSAQNRAWVHQLGSPLFESAVAAAPDGAGGFFTGVYCLEPFGGNPTQRPPTWLARFDGAGKAIWARKLDLSTAYSLTALAPDGAGGCFACGYGAWLGRFDAMGQTLWFRTIDSGAQDIAVSVASDGLGGALVGGRTLGSLGSANKGSSDAWFARYDSNGNSLWIRQLGTASLDALGAVVATGGGGAFLAGLTFGKLGASNPSGNSDLWLARYDAAGNPKWVTQVGSPDSDGMLGISAAPDGLGGLFVCADTFGSIAGPSSGEADVWLARFDGTGIQLWSRQLGTSQRDVPVSSISDQSGGVYLAGYSYGSFGAPGLGDSDIWLGRFDNTGNELWTTQFGTAQRDRAFALARLAPDQVFVVGETGGELGGTNAGLVDAWMARFDSGCLSTATYCTASATSIPGCQASISGLGTPSFSNPSAFTIRSGNVPGGNLGLCYFGGAAGSSPLGSLGGVLCVQPPFQRSKTHLSGGTPGYCDGQYTFTLQDLLASSPIVAVGSALHVAIWARDPANPDGYLLSNGLEFSVCP